MTAPKIAGAPISWGISEVEGWGHQLPIDRVLGEMTALGITATELGPDGFLPPRPQDKAAVLSRFGLAAVGSFLPLVLFDADVDPLPRVQQELDAYAATGAGTLVLAAVTGLTGYDAQREDLTDAEWATLFANLDRAAERAAGAGVTAVLHPHAGTLVETTRQIERVLEGSAIPFCFDTGHLLIGGTDPVLFAREHAARIAHTHLKDVSRTGIERVASGELSYHEAVRQDLLYRPLGEGDIDISAIVADLLASGYDGWFVLEQDKVLADEPAPGRGPVEDAAASVAFVRELVSSRLAN